MKKSPSNHNVHMFSRSGSRLLTMRVTRQIVLHLLQKHSTSLAVIKKKFGLFQNFGSNNAANLLSCPETILHGVRFLIIHSLAEKP